MSHLRADIIVNCYYQNSSGIGFLVQCRAFVVIEVSGELTPKRKYLLFLHLDRVNLFISFSVVNKQLLLLLLLLVLLLLLLLLLLLNLWQYCSRKPKWFGTFLKVRPHYTFNYLYSKFSLKLLDWLAQLCRFWVVSIFFLSQGTVHFALKSCQNCYFNSIKSFTFIVSHLLCFSLKLCVCELLEGWKTWSVLMVWTSRTKRWRRH